MEWMEWNGNENDKLNDKLQGTRGWTRITRLDLIKRNLSPRTVEEGRAKLIERNDRYRKK